MGTYTANKNLYMPSVGETGWGTLMNGNLETIDTFLKPITVSGSTYTFTGNHVGNQSGGTITATKITNSGTLTQTGTSTFTGKITANGGIGTTSLTTSSTITSTGKITGNGGIAGTTGTFSGAVSCTKLTESSPGAWTVTSTNTYPSSTQSFMSLYQGEWVILLPKSNKKYNGSIKIYSDYAGAIIAYVTNLTGAMGDITTVQGFNTITLTNADCFYMRAGINSQYVRLCNFTIS